MNTMCLKRLWWGFLSPHLTLSTQNPPVCGLWGGCTGAAYRSDWKERRRKKHTFKQQRFKSVIGF